MYFLVILFANEKEYGMIIKVRDYIMLIKYLDQKGHDSVERIIITWKYIRIIITTTTKKKKKKTRPDKGNKRNLSWRTKNPPKYMEKQTIFPSAKYQRTVNPPSN